MKKKKTEIARKIYNEHVWNEAFTFNLPASNFNTSGIEVMHEKIQHYFLIKKSYYSYMYLIMAVMSKMQSEVVALDLMRASAKMILWEGIIGRR